MGISLRIGLAALFGSLVLCACHGRRDSSTDVFVQSKSADALIHMKSGFSFPAQVGNFHRQGATQYDAAGEDISMGYNDYANPVAATVYVYPAGGRSLAEELSARQAELTHAHQDAKLLGTGKLDFGGGRTVQGAAYDFGDVFGGNFQPLYSEVLVGLSGKHFIEYRFTCPTANKAAAAGDMAAFAKQLNWP